LIQKSYEVEFSYTPPVKKQYLINFLYPARQKAIPYQFYTGKVATARYFAVNVLSGVKVRCEALKVGEKAPLEIVEEAFAF